MPPSPLRLSPFPLSPQQHLPLQQNPYSPLDETSPTTSVSSQEACWPDGKSNDTQQQPTQDADGSSVSPSAQAGAYVANPIRRPEIVQPNAQAVQKFYASGPSSGPGPAPDGMSAAASVSLKGLSADTALMPSPLRINRADKNKPLPNPIDQSFDVEYIATQVMNKCPSFKQRVYLEHLIEASCANIQGRPTRLKMQERLTEQVWLEICLSRGTDDDWFNLAQLRLAAVNIDGELFTALEPVKKKRGERAFDFIHFCRRLIEWLPEHPYSPDVTRNVIQIMYALRLDFSELNERQKNAMQSLHDKYKRANLHDEDKGPELHDEDNFFRVWQAFAVTCSNGTILKKFAAKFYRELLDYPFEERDWVAQAFIESKSEEDQKILLKDYIYNSNYDTQIRSGQQILEAVCIQRGKDKDWYHLVRSYSAQAKKYDWFIFDCLKNIDRRDNDRVKNRITAMQYLKEESLEEEHGGNPPYRSVVQVMHAFEARFEELKDDIQFIPENVMTGVLSTWRQLAVATPEYNAGTEALTAFTEAYTNYLGQQATARRAK